MSRGEFGEGGCSGSGKRARTASSPSRASSARPVAVAEAERRSPIGVPTRRSCEPSW